MKVHTKLGALVAAAMLAACGGGGGDPADGQDAAATPSTGGSGSSNSTGSGMTAKFQQADDSVAILRGGASFSTMSRPTFQQRDDGAIVALSGASLGGVALVKDIHSDVDVAMGRWAAGDFKLRADDASQTLTEEGGSYSYVLLNRVSTLPTTGSVQCDSGAFTSPSHAGGTAASSVSTTGTASGTASLAFGPNGASYTLKIDVSTQESTGTRNGNGTITSPNNVSIVGNNLANADAMVVIGRAAGTNAYLLAGNYSATLANGAKYSGAFKFRCA